MKKIFIFLFFIVAFSAVAQKANPSFQSFDPTQFDTNGYVITIDPGVITNATTSWLPGVGYEVWYEPFSGGDVSTTSGTIGTLGWTEDADIGFVGLTNAVNHWGLVSLITTASAGSKQSIYNSDCTNCRPTIPPMNATTGWTNRIIWRVTTTNSIRGFLSLIGTTGFISQSALAEGVGVYFDTTNTASIMGMTALASTLSTTNLGNFVAGQWYTNIIWCSSAGVFSFSMNGGAEATLNSNIPTSGLTPYFGILKTETTVISIMEVDEWALWWKRL